jgi:hypothetical protein
MTKYKKPSPIACRLIRHFAQGKKFSIKNMFLARVSNAAREIRRNYEIPFGIELNRELIKWKDDFGNGTYFEYTTSDLLASQELARKYKILY